MSNLKKNKRKSHLNSSQPFKLNVKKHVLTTCFKLFEEEEQEANEALFDSWEDEY